MTSTPLLTVIETPSFLRDAKKLLDDEEREALVNCLSSTPNAGVLIKGTGGIRKIRWAQEDTGKSGAYRVIYFFILWKFRFLF
jgi:mRNA-degrading endonuclease RelE of RelBE toxin-antitoxin system